MIDLHMHTTYSDGTDSVKEILSNAQTANLEVISITDHNTCASYNEMESFDIKAFFNGDIIAGCEFTTSFDNRLIEVLGYGFDYKKVQDYLNHYCSNKLTYDGMTVTTILFNRLSKIIDDLGLTFDLENAKKNKSENEFFEHCIYEELVSYSENKEILKEDVWKSFSDFYRKGLTNPNSKLFINSAEFKPQLKEILKVIHEAGGKAFLAHPYQYKFDDTEKFIEKMYNENDLDGIECFYTTFSNEQTDYLVNFANERDLLISGGSDYHGKNKQMHDLGKGKGNLSVDNKILYNWNIDYFMKK